MKAPRLSTQLRNYFDSFVDDARERDFPPDIIEALQELSEFPNQLSIDIEGILREAALEGTKNKSLAQDLLEFIRRFFRDDIRREMKNALTHVGTDPFLYANKKELSSFLDGFVKRLETAIERLKTGTVGYQEEAAQLHRRLIKQEQAYFKLQQECEIRLTHTSRDYQMVLARLGPTPTGETEREVMSILESGLEDMGITVIWDMPKNDIGEYFVNQNDSEVKSPHVSRPCLVRGSKVIHKGVLINLSMTIE